MTVVDHDLVIVEAQDGVAAEGEPRVGSEVSSPVGRSAVVAEAVDLDRKPFADDTVERMAVHPHLLSHVDANRAHPFDEDRLGAGVGPAADGSSEAFRGVASPSHPRERIQRHRPMADGGLPDRTGLDGRPTSRDLEEDIEDGIDRRSRMRRHRSLGAVHLDAAAVEPRSGTGEGDVYVRGPDIPPSGESRSAHTGDSPANRSSRPAPWIDIGEEEPRPAHALECAFLHRATHLVLGEARLTYARRMRGASLLSNPALDPRASHPSTLSARAALSITALGMGKPGARFPPCAGSVVA